MIKASDRTNSQLCPVCEAVISSESINIKEGVALCGSCGQLSRLSELNFSGVTVEETIENPPAGCRLSASNGKIVMTASLYSPGGFLGSLAAALFWNGIVSLFVSVAAAGVYYNAIGPLPDWFPALGIKNGAPIMNDEIMGAGMTLFLCLFLTPFVVIGCALLVSAVLKAGGQTTVVIDAFDSYVSTGWSLITWKSRFDPSAVQSITYVRSKFQQNGETSTLLELTSPKKVKFGTFLRDDQKEWFAVVLKEILVKSNPNKLNALFHQDHSHG